MSNPYPLNIANSIIANASNIPQGTNPAFTEDDFFSFYPQFQSKVDSPILAQFIAMADACVPQDRWKALWNFGMCNFIAHFVTLYLQMATGCSTAAQVISTAQARGLQTSKSVGDVSVSYDFSQTLGDIEGWATFKQTQYGLQYLSMARLLGKAGVYVW